jgi:hypothetical protein
MLTPKDLIEIYCRKITGRDLLYYQKEYDDLAIHYSFDVHPLQYYLDMPVEFWRPYWDNIVKVCQVIANNQENFNMQEWHCGSTHCLAGWAQCLSEPKKVYGTINYLYHYFEPNKLYKKRSKADLFSSDIVRDAVIFLSPVMAPFFYLSGRSSEMMDEFILPVASMYQSKNRHTNETPTRILP